MFSGKISYFKLIYSKKCFVIVTLLVNINGIVIIIIIIKVSTIKMLVNFNVVGR